MFTGTMAWFGMKKLNAHTCSTISISRNLNFFSLSLKEEHREKINGSVP